MLIVSSGMAVVKVSLSVEQSKAFVAVCCAHRDTFASALSDVALSILHHSQTLAVGLEVCFALACESQAIYKLS